jgi:hypothetical protein
MMSLNHLLENAILISKDPNSKMEKSNGLYHLPTFICLLWETIFTLNYYMGNSILSIGGSMPPLIVLLLTIGVGIATFIFTIIVAIKGYVYSYKKEVPLDMYIFKSILGLIFICMPFFLVQGFELYIDFLIG